MADNQAEGVDLAFIEVGTQVTFRCAGSAIVSGVWRHKDFSYPLIIAGGMSEPKDYAAFNFDGGRVPFIYMPERRGMYGPTPSPFDIVRLVP